MSTDVTRLYDQELESLVWDDSEAKCPCGAPATCVLVWTDCAHSTRAACETCAEMGRVILMRKMRLGITQECVRCGSVKSPELLTIRPI